MTAAAEPTQTVLTARMAPAVKISIGIAVAAFVLCLRSPDPAVIAVGAIALIVIIQLLMRGDDPPLLLLPFAYQWAQIATKPILGAAEKTPLNQLADYSGDLRAATLFGFIAIAVLAGGVVLGLGRNFAQWNRRLRDELLGMDFGAILMLSLSMLGVGLVISTFAYIYPSFRQILLALNSVCIGGVFPLAYWCLSHRRGYGVLTLVMLFEIGIGFTGFFSDFRFPLLLFIMAVICVYREVKIGSLIALMAAAVLLVSLGAFWSHIKQDYRTFVTRGTHEQIVAVDLSERVDYVRDQIKLFDKAAYIDGLDRLTKRFSYTDFLANTIIYVPSNVPHTRGHRLIFTVLNTIEPRFMFPDKPPTEWDSDVTREYTGLDLGNSATTSISIGYLGEYYIDFGYIGAIICVGVMGFGFGTMFRMVAAAPGYALSAAGLIAAASILNSDFGTAMVKIVGGMVLSIAAAMIVQVVLLPAVLSLLEMSGLRQPLKPRPS